MTTKHAIPVRPLKRGPGRPRSRGVLPFSHYEGSTQGNKRPRCKARGCDQYLKRHQVVACSEDCLTKVEIEATVTLEGVERDKQTSAIAAVVR